MKLTETEIIHNWNELMNFIEDNFKGDRQTKLKAMYTDLEDRMAMAPASSVNHYHNAIPGGYVDHVLRVIKCAQEVYKLWKRMGADMDGYTEEELLFVALNHDIGKMGFPGEGNEIYIPNDSDWHVKNQGKVYKHNPKNPFALVNDLSIWLLQHYDIDFSFNEMIGIKLTDGLYDESNKPYFISRMPDSKLRFNMPYVMHQADLMAARIEYEMWAQNQPDPGKKKPPVKKKATPKEVTTAKNAINFDDFFN